MTLSPTSSVTLGKRKSHLFMCICVCVCCICKIRYFKESLCELYEVAPIKYLTHSRYSINDSYSDNAEEEAAGGTGSTLDSTILHNRGVIFKSLNVNNFIILPKTRAYPIPHLHKLAQRNAVLDRKG